MGGIEDAGHGAASGGKADLGAVTAAPVFGGQADGIVLIGPGEESHRAVIPAEPDHDPRLLAGLGSVPEFLLMGLSGADVIRETHHAHLLPLRQGLVQPDDLIEAVRLPQLGVLIRQEAEIIHLRIRGDAHGLPRQEGKDRRTVHALGIPLCRVIENMDVLPVVFLMGVQILVDIGDHRPFPGEAVGMEDIHVQSRVLAPFDESLLIVARGQTSVEHRVVPHRQGIGQAGKMGEIRIHRIRFGPVPAPGRRVPLSGGLQNQALHRQGADRRRKLGLPGRPAARCQAKEERKGKQPGKSTLHDTPPIVGPSPVRRGQRCISFSRKAAQLSRTLTRMESAAQRNQVPGRGWSRTPLNHCSR